MRTIPLPEFKKLVARNDWQREQNINIIDRICREETVSDEETGSMELVEIPHAFGVATKTSTLEDVRIVYTESFNYDEYDPESLHASTEGQDNIWSVEGIIVLDEDGSEMDEVSLSWYLTRDFSSINYGELLVKQITDIDVDSEDKTMDTYTLEIDNNPDIRFTGELIAKVSSSGDRATGSRYSGQTGRWTTLALYKTKGGKYVCHQIGHTLWEGERDRHSGKVCDTLEEVKAFFGYRWLAKDLYAEAGIDDAVDID
ncbi:hypothetical protein HAQ00_04970 [Acidithiobacillus caldus ATCC 51756]|nr:hypothetical protein [Acidithiobacillus caldus ATCC 51756]MBU2801671.1 hypothetical protein [Acidithiobacillus caldus]